MTQTSDTFELTTSQHKRQHKKWQAPLEAVLDDYVSHHPGETKIYRITAIELIAWNDNQCENPTELTETLRP